MATTDTPTTLSELQTQTLNLVGEPTTSTALTNLATRYLNMALYDVHQERWWWAERRSQLELHTSYTTGTVDLALSARTTVTGSSTLWNTTVTGMGWTNARAGGKMTFQGATDVYPVSSVGSDTAITLAEPFIGDTALDDATYVYFEDEYELASDFDDEHGIFDAISFYQNREIRVIPSSEFYRMFARNSTPGSSIRAATIIHLGPSGSVARRPRLVIAPPSSVQRTIPYRYYTKHLATNSSGTGQENLSAATDQPIIPLKWRYALVFLAASYWKRDRHDDLRSGEYKGLYDQLILRARQSTDAADNRPRIVPRSAASYRQHARRPWSGAGRFDGGDYFDELRDRNG